MAYLPFQAGQQPMSSSQGVVIASDQSPVSITGTVLVGGVPNVNATGSVVAFQGGVWNPSISGTVGASIIGLPPVNVVGTPSISGAVTVIGNPSVSGTVGASVIGLPPFRLSDGTETLDLYQENQQDASVVGVAIMFKSNVSTSIMSVPSPSTPLPIIGSVSGSVGIVGNPSISGTVNVAGNPSISGTVNIGIIPGSVVGFQGGTRITSVSGAVTINPASVSGTVGASIIGAVPVTQITNPWIITGSIQGGGGGTQYEENEVDASVVGNAIMWKSNLSSSIMSVVNPANPLPVSVQGTVNIGTQSGSVLAYQAGTRITSIVSTVPSSVLVGASIFGQLPAGTALIGSVATLQGTNPWIVNFANSSILATQQGTQISSIVNSIPSSVLVGNYGHRNDSTSSFLGGNLTWNPLATDSAGRVLAKPFVSDDGTLIEYASSVTSTSVTTIRTSVIGMRQYVTDFWIANTGSVATRVTFQDGSTSVLAHTIAPAGGGSNAVGINIPFKSARAQDLAFVAGSPTSILYVTVRGYQAP